MRLKGVEDFAWHDVVSTAPWHRWVGSLGRHGARHLFSCVGDGFDFEVVIMAVRTAIPWAAGRVSRHEYGEFHETSLS